MYYVQEKKLGYHSILLDVMKFHTLDIPCHLVFILKLTIEVKSYQSFSIFFPYENSDDRIL